MPAEGTSGCAPSRGAWALIAILLAGVAWLFWSASSSKDISPRDYPMYAVGTLKTIGTAQELHREGTGRGDDAKPTYATLVELSDEQRVDRLLGSGTKLGYLFTCQPSPTTPGSLWMARSRSTPPARSRPAPRRSDPCVVRKIRCS